MNSIILLLTSFMAETVAASNFTVELFKQDVPVFKDGRVVSHKTAYFGEVEVGARPQNFTVVFDTGSGHLFLPSVVCIDEPCLLHRRYDREASPSAVDINHDGGLVNVDDQARDQVAIAYGTGEIVGEFVRDRVCLTSSSDLAGARGQDEINCAGMRVITAREMTSEPFTNFKFDGVLGLGLAGLALDPEFHFLTQLTKTSAVLPVFGVYLVPWSRRQELADSEAVGEITFGGHDVRRTSRPLSWVPVIKPENGHWSIQVNGIRLGDELLPFCDDGTCTAIFDTGTSMLGVPRAIKNDLIMKTAREATESASGAIDCRDVPGPSIVFELDGGLKMSLDAQDYSRPVPTTVQLQGKSTQICRSSLLPIDMPSLGPKVFIFGEPVIQRYYTAFDARSPPRIGFAPAKSTESVAAGSIVV